MGILFPSWLTLAGDKVDISPSTAPFGISNTKNTPQIREFIRTYFQFPVHPMRSPDAPMAHSQAALDKIASPSLTPRSSAPHP